MDFRPTYRDERSGPARNIIRTGSGTGPSRPSWSRSKASRRIKRSWRFKRPCGAIRTATGCGRVRTATAFIAELARAAPELRVDLPPTAIGKDYLIGRRLFARAPSGTGWQVSILGLVGVLVAREEGIEINLFGAVFGVDLDPPAFKLPIVGRLGFAEGRRADPADLEKLSRIPPEYRCH